VAVFELRKVSKRYRRNWVFRDLEYSWEGGLLLLSGPNGQGKSTLLRLLAGLSRPTRGTVRVLGGDPWKDEYVRARLGYAGHESGLYPSLSGRENLEVFRRLQGGDPRNLERLAESLGVVRFWGRPVREYSEGMRKKISLIRAFLHDPQLLLLDEPFAALDSEGREVLWRWIQDRVRQGTHVVLVSHILEGDLPGVQRVCLMEKKLHVLSPQGA